MDQELSTKERIEALTFLIEDLRRHLEGEEAQMRDILFQHNCELVRYEVLKENDRMEQLPQMQHELRELEERIEWKRQYLREQGEILRLYEHKLETLRRETS